MKTRPTSLTTVLILAAALAGCSADPAAPPVPTALDTSPPAVPTDLNAAAATNLTVKVAWAPNVTDPDCVGYHVYRLAFGAVWPQTDAPVAGTAWLDRAPLRGPVAYAVTAVDAAGNESAWARVEFAFAGERIGIACD